MRQSIYYRSGKFRRNTGFPVKLFPAGNELRNPRPNAKTGRGRFPYSAEAGARANETAGDKKTPATFVALLKMFIAITT
jgi:hypothetical protein